jgi:general secretion pathway protein L
MEQGLNNLRHSARNVARRAGLPRFWRWWSAELAPLIPSSSRGAMRRRLTRPVVEFSEREATFWRPLVVEDELRLVEVGRVSLSGDPGEVAAAGRAAMNALAIATSKGAASVLPKVVVALPPKQVMRKTLILPAAVEENLEQALRYDLDRHTPFRPEQVYFDATVIDRKPITKTIGVDWVAALKSVVDGARRQVEDWGGVVVAVVPGPTLTQAPRGTRLNLIPHETRPHSTLWRRWQLWVPVAAVALGMLAVLVVPLLQKREFAIALNKQTESAREQAEASDALRSQLERQQGDYNYVLEKKYAYPAGVQVIDDITRLLPDDTWITQLEVRSTVRGKDNVRELTLRGESANAGALISTLEGSNLVEQAALQSPTTKLQPGPGEVFVLGARMRNATPPPPVPVTLATAGAAAEPPAAPPPAVPAAETTPAATVPASPPADTGPAAVAPAAPAASPPAPAAYAPPAAPTETRSLLVPVRPDAVPGVPHIKRSLRNGGATPPAPASNGGS